MESLERMFSSCSLEPCSSKCCASLGLPLHHGCDPEWANAYAHFVLSKRNVPCQRTCPMKPMCFLFGDDSPCFDEACASLFTSGVLERRCHDRIKRHCAEMGIVSSDCAAFQKAVDKCGAESRSWANCAAAAHSTNHFLLELKRAHSSHREMIDVSNHAVQWQSRFGFTTTPLAPALEKCVMRFRVSTDRIRMVPCAFTVSVTPTDLTPVVYFDSVLSIVLFLFSVLVFWCLRRSTT